MKKVTIKIPRAVSLVGLNGLPVVMDEDGKQAVITFNLFVKGTLLVDPKFGRSMADILSAVEIKNQLDRLDSDAKELDLEYDDWDRLNKVAAEPSSGYNPVVVMQISEFLTAIRDAK